MFFSFYSDEELSGGHTASQFLEAKFKEKKIVKNTLTSLLAFIPLLFEKTFLRVLHFYHGEEGCVSLYIIHNTKARCRTACKDFLLCTVLCYCF